MNNNSKAAAKRTQVVYSEPRKLLVSSKTLPNGQRVNTYRKNKNAKPIKFIVHPTIPARNGKPAWNCFKANKNR